MPVFMFYFDCSLALHVCFLSSDHSGPLTPSFLPSDIDFIPLSSLTFIPLFCMSRPFFSYGNDLFFFSPCWISFLFSLLCSSFLSPISDPLSPTLQYVDAEDSMLQAVFSLLACLRNLFYLLKVFALGLFVVLIFLSFISSALFCWSLLCLYFSITSSGSALALVLASLDFTLIFRHISLSSVFSVSHTKLFNV